MLSIAMVVINTDGAAVTGFSYESMTVNHGALVEL